MENKLLLTKEQLTRLLNPHFFNFEKLNDVYHVEYKLPLDLLGSRRFDIIAKYIYAKHKKLGVNSSWAERLYMNHIYAFNNGIEGDGSSKESVMDFVNAYNELISSISHDGFDINKTVVPIGNHGEPLDGAHRVAVCLAYDLKVPVVRFDQSCCYDYRYFVSRGLERAWCDVIALEMAKLFTDSYIIIIFPSAQGKDQEIAELISDYCEICYQKDVELNQNGALNLIKVIYKGESWIGDWNNNFSGAKGKMEPCFQNDGPVRVYLVRAADPEQLILLKKQIRDLFGIGNHSVHINDHHEETVRLAQTFFNDNSIHFLNYSKLNGRFRNFIDLHERYKLWVENSGISPEYFCVDSSAVMGAYGIREPNDLDFICFLDYAQSGYSDISNHEAYTSFLPKPKNEIIFNPAYHFYYDGLKYASIAVVREMKNKRSEGKDIIDVQLIDYFFEQDMNFAGENDEQNDELIGKKIILFGASTLGSEYSKKLEYPVAYYVDNDSRKWGTLFDGITVKSPDQLLEENPDNIAIIISSMYVDEISSQLHNMGFVRGVHFWGSLFEATSGDFIRKIAYCGFKLYYNRGESLVKGYLSEGYYEKELCEQIVKKLESVEHPVFLDVGSHVGLISFYVASRIRSAAIYAFEPSPLQNLMMKYTIYDNKLQEKVYLFDEALGCEEGEPFFYVHSPKDASSDGLVETKQESFTKRIKIKGTTLDSWWEKHGQPHVNVVKINTEGSEFWVLTGGKKMISSCKPIIYFEMKPHKIEKYPYTAFDILKWFDELGYNVQSVFCGNIITKENLDQYYGKEDFFVGCSNI
jgi:FkbM family methyltransferase